jgi:apolipoprotein N-acyltransferase
VGGLLRAAIPTALALVLVALPAFPTQQTGTLRVGAVQGDTKAGYFDPPERVGDNLLGQLAATEPLVGEDVDVVLWPEGSSDVDPITEPWAARRFDRVVAEVGAPLVAGIITTRGDEWFNEAVVWDDGEVQDYYDKRHPVPFAEYVPDREVWRPFAPDLIDLVGREYSIGTTDLTLDVAGVRAGVAICFDIVDDGVMTGMVDEGADIVFAPTNNADFGEFTDESVQQLAIAQIRAIETGRAVVNVSTVGTSAMILPDGTIVERLPTYEPGTMLAELPLSDTVTPAVAVGRQLEQLAGLTGLAGLLVGFVGTRRRR